MAKQKKYKKSLPKRLSNLFFVLFFCIFSAFTLLAYISTNYFLLKREKQTIFQAVNIVRVRLSEVDSNFTLENLAEVLYKNDRTHLKIDDANGSRIIRSERDITNTLNANEDIYVYNVDKQMIFTTDDEEASPGLNGPIGKVTKDHIEEQYKGFSMTQKVYSNKTGKFVGYVQVFHDLENYYMIRARLFFWLLVVELFGVGLAYFIILIVTRNFLKPLNNLHDVMRTISKNPDNLMLRSGISSGDEIEELSVIFDKMLDKIETHTRLQSRFISDVSHELRTPVAIIKGHIGLLQRWGKDDSAILDESLTAAAHEVDRMAIMINDMLDMIRVQGSFEGHQNDTTTLESSIETVVGNFRVLREDFDFTWYSENQRTLAKIYKNHFEQALMILIDNAVKYSRKEKKIVIELSVNASKEAVVKVKDRGEGISEEDIKHIFERFYRTDRSRNRTSTQAGLGIGLSILKQIVDGYHLHMEVESELNKGSVFILRIPLADHQGL
ncbi:TPA: HAMP domain-containing protein [Streptococcus equi subsp. zooepidemicus]|uniref:Signal transduction histidine-protein kinase ArlS n=1 Tax=Streptococcus equi subsp. ruminatorum TaxID=254358 RepID=A0A6M1KNS6_9STRE|nr:HAMP domain-containing histidine kinase [Streptococcus equi]NGL84409.1 HAMP domain-containing histidine kinase [Streptococcus equi subsp. ruminatorum]WOK56953.1 HAMP domain-containing histidine kinase [Streptococcus equi subsp. zooepidemicus]HEK9098713.1 HAMP domain-containing protein [Streptococcus equi subsp. zooepidemicus]HEL0024581.1 HAMP domain-containing protein [Streptococcus equi subsp. zooepidemicus]HEL0757072.1 HAMP domain-containing protein [Streptococcus equi subsp. zooepidemicu